MHQKLPGVGAQKNAVTLAQSNADYVSMFDTEKNELPPTEIALKSGLKVWWPCENGHNFQRTPYDMTKNDSCPVCNSLPVKYPQVAEQWDHEKNHSRKPQDYSWGSGQKVWWRCSKGHSWKTAINQRTSAGYGCPHCYNERRGREYQELAVKRNGSLADANPPYLSEWDYKKNVGISPDSVTVKSTQKVWWICPNNHSYTQALISKANGSICPECAKIKRAESSRRTKLKQSGSLADNHPDIAEQWHHHKNGTLSPRDVSSGSHQSVWWCCDKGHEWQESPNRRTDKRRPKGCPICRRLRPKMEGPD